MWCLKLGCSAIVAIPFAVAGAVIAIVNGAPLREAAVSAAMVGVMVFVVALLLFSVDQARWSADRGRIHQWLTNRDDMEDEHFLANIEPPDHELALSIRRRLAEYFGAAPMKIRPGDELKLLSFDRFMPGIYVFVFGNDTLSGPGRDRGFPRTALRVVKDLIAEAKLLKQTG
jgi:hypothetical protein